MHLLSSASGGLWLQIIDSGFCQIDNRPKWSYYGNYNKVPQGSTSNNPKITNISIGMLEIYLGSVE